jgi:hypothetical protein
MAWDIDSNHFDTGGIILEISAAGEGHLPPIGISDEI